MAMPEVSVEVRFAEMTHPVDGRMDALCGDEAVQIRGRRLPGYEKSDVTAGGVKAKKRSQTGHNPFRFS